MGALGSWHPLILSPVLGVVLRPSCLFFQMRSDFEEQVMNREKEAGVVEEKYSQKFDQFLKVKTNN